FHELEGEATQSVAVGNHNLCDLSCKDGVQNPRETRAFPVEPAANVRDEFVVWVSLDKIVFLSLEIGSLECRGDTGVEDQLAVVSLRSWFGLVEKKLVNLVCVVATTATWGADSFDFAFICPVADCRNTDTILLSNQLGTNKFT